MSLETPPEPAPSAALEFTAALAMALAAGMTRRQREAFLTRWNLVFVAYSEDRHIQVVAARHAAALRAARFDAEDWFQRYLPAFLNP